MNVLVWTQYYYPEKFVITDVVDELRQCGANITVITGKPNYPQGKVYAGYNSWGVQIEKHDDVEIFRLPIIPRGKKNRVQLALNYLSFVFSGLLLSNFLLKNKKFDLVFVFGNSPIIQALPAIFIAKRRKISLALWVQDLWPEILTAFIKNKFLMSVITVVAEYVYRNSDLIIAQSQSFIPNLKKHAQRTDKIVYMPNPSRRTKFVKAKQILSRELINEIRTHKSFIIAGNIGVAQDVDTIINAAEKLHDQPEIKFFLFGDGNQKERLQSLIQSKKLTNVLLICSVSREALQQAYLHCFGFLITLRADGGLNETLPRRFSDYLSIGKPVIAATGGEVERKVIETGCGLTCPPSDPSALARTIKKAAQLSKFEYEWICKRSSKLFEKEFEMSTVMGQLNSHLKSLLSTNLSK